MDGSTDATTKLLLQRAENRDGLAELSAGLNLLIAAALIHAQAVLPRGSTGFTLAVLAFSFLLPVSIFSSRWVLTWVRRHYLIERIGYVEYRPMTRRQIGLSVMVAAVVLLALLGVVFSPAQPDRWLLAGTGLIGGAFVAWCGRLVRFVIEGIAMAVAGVVVALAGLPLELGFTMLFGFEGLLAAGAGLVVFLRFVRLPVEAGP